MTNTLEKQIIEVIATDRIYIPISSMDSKLKRARTDLAGQVKLSNYKNNFHGKRVYARVESEDKQVARGLKEGVSVFSESYPKYGKILQGMIEHERTKRETHLYFGINPNCKLTSDDYLGVMTDLGFTKSTAQSLYPELMDVSRNLAKKRQQNERSILIG